ncbi:hypothetical protein Hanom_Chr12g01106231 [Helianthus anomalus]
MYGNYENQKPYSLRHSFSISVFESFGMVELVQLPTDETWNCKGFGFGFIQGCTEFEQTAGDCRSNDEVCGLHGRCLMKCLMG